MRTRRARLGIAALLFTSRLASADELVLDLDAALARARAASPDALAQRGRIDEAEARRVGAGLRFVDNPELEVEGGPRFAAATSIDLAVQVGQRVELGGRRGARRAVAEAGVVQARAEGDAALRALDLEVASAFYACVHAERVLAATREASELAARGLDAAERGGRAGQLTDLEIDLARAAAGRARAAIEDAEAARAAAIGELAGLLGLAADDTVTVRGELRPPPLPDAGPAPTERADLRALTAAGATADAELRLARARGAPELGVWLGYGREEDAHLALVGIRLSLPLWNRGQGERAEARARKLSAAAEHALAARVATRAQRDARARYDAARRAVEIYEREVLPALADGEQLLARSLDAGQLSVSDFLLTRTELLDGRREYLDRLLALALADVRARFELGVLP